MKVPKKTEPQGYRYFRLGEQTSLPASTKIRIGIEIRIGAHGR